MAFIFADTQMDGGRLMRAVMAFSGGMDSTGLLIRLLSKGYKVSTLSYDYGQKHVIEIERAKSKRRSIWLARGISKSGTELWISNRP